MYVNVAGFFLWDVRPLGGTGSVVIGRSRAAAGRLLEIDYVA